jgi:hypothetical protein
MSLKSVWNIYQDSTSRKERRKGGKEREKRRKKKVREGRKEREGGREEGRKLTSLKNHFFKDEMQHA